MKLNTIINADVFSGIKKIPDESIDLIITSPPYFNLRDYENGPDALGLESTPKEYVDKIVALTDDLYRVLKKNGVLFLNIGDRYYNNIGFHRSNMKKHQRKTQAHFKNLPQLKEHGGVMRFKQRMQLPNRIAIEMQNGLWLMRHQWHWVKPNAMPVSCKDRPRPITEEIFLLVKTGKYCYNKKFEKGAIDLSTDILFCDIEPFGEHQASFPEKLIEPLINLGSNPGDVVFDPFCGSGTVPYMAKKLGRQYIGMDLNKDYCRLTEKRLKF